MSENLKTIKEVADELGVSKKKIENKLSYIKKKGNTLGKVIGGVRYLNKQEIKILNISPETSKVPETSEVPETSKVPETSEVPEKSKVPETSKVPDNHVFSSSFDLLREQTDYLLKELEEKNKHIEKLIDNEKSMQNLLDQQQRLALQDKKLLEEYKSEINELKALKMPQEDMKDGSSIRGEAQEEIERLKAQLKLSEEERNKAKEKEPVKTESKKWWQLWK